MELGEQIMVKRKLVDVVNRTRIVLLHHEVVLCLHVRALDVFLKRRCFCDDSLNVLG